MSKQRYQEKMFASLLLVIVSIFGLSTYSEAQNWNSRLKDEAVYYTFHSWRNYRVEASQNPRQLSSSLIDNEFARDQIKKTGLINFLVYEEGQITQDFKDTSWSVGSGLMSDETILVSNSIGRNVVSYLVGHAICEGVITNSDSTIADWPMVQNTVYANAKIIDLLNMTAGDGGILNRSKDPDDITIAGTAIRPSMVPLEAFMGSDFFKGKKPVGNRYNYNGLVTRVLLGYLIHKVGSNYHDFLTRVITTNIRNEHPVFMLKTFGLEEAGNAKITTFMTRYDYLRFAIRLLDDWNSDTCIGEYLREIYQRRVRKGEKFSGGRGRNGAASSYGGQFHFDYSGYSGRRIAGMDGFGGQSILIDLDRKKIVIAHAMQADYDWHKLVLREIGR